MTDSRNRELGYLIAVGAPDRPRLRQRLHRPPGRRLVGLAHLRRPVHRRSTSSRTSSRAARCRTPTRTCCRWPALLTAVGLTEIYRLEPRRRVQAGALDRDRRRALRGGADLACAATTACSSRTSTSSASARSCCSSCRGCPGIGTTVNGARLWVHVGSFQFQPGELAKIALIVFLAAYLREKREVLAQGRLKDVGPLLLIWGAAMLVLVVDERPRLGRSSTSGSSSRCSTSRRRGSRTSRVGVALFAVGGCGRVHADRARPRPRHDLAPPVDGRRRSSARRPAGWRCGRTARATSS